MDNNQEKQLSPYQIKRMEDAKALAKQVADSLNTMSYEEAIEHFNKTLSQEHRTLQQCYTNMVFAWIKHVASDEYKVDGRNEASKEACQKLLAFMKENNIEKMPFI